MRTSTSPQLRPFSLLDVDDGFARCVPREEQPLARRALVLPARSVERATYGYADLLPHGVDGGRWLLLTEGVVAVEASVGDRAIVHILGPGDLVAPPPRDVDGLDPVCTTSHRADTRAVVVALDGRFDAAARAWPALSAEFQARVAAQHHRLLCQTAILGLPRVTDRVLGVLQLLAQSWGRVRPGGILVPLELTHARLGAMTGSRRPTVSLALRELAESGTVVRAPEGWLIARKASMDGAGAPVAAHVPPGIPA
jgi:CRP/FNR family transcriptional regulator, cyclic AMP receptor protein